MDSELTFYTSNELGILCPRPRNKKMHKSVKNKKKTPVVSEKSNQTQHKKNYNCNEGKTSWWDIKKALNKDAHFCACYVN